ncbi:MAG: hypothetical protein JXB38_18555 [Anaerolineales bacterium]|nr:hypothetical protein [Anaerolineales bacterium]
MTTKVYKLSAIILILSITASACTLGGGTPEQPTETPAEAAAEVPTETPTVAPDEPTPTVAPPTPTTVAEDVPMTASISGRVWHDVCAYTGEGEIPTNAPPGCVAAENGGWVANGFPEEGEAGIGSVKLNLGEGACPATITKIINSNAEGYFTFPNLAPGDYCISIDPNEEQNLTLNPPLLPGQFTAPFYGSGEATITLGAGEQRSEVNFGWDYLNLPQPAAACDNVASLVEHVTIPPGSVVTPGAPFEKVWKLRNDGTCVWTPEYTLVFDSGELMGAPSPVPFPRAVAAGEEVDLSVTFIAPGDDGSYSSNWSLRDDLGADFGTGPNADEKLTVSISISPNLLWSNLGEPGWNDEFENSDNWNVFDDNYGHMYIDGGRMIYTGRQAFDTWVGSYPIVDDMNMEAIITTGSECTGSNRYGIIIRTDITDTGYLFGFTCDGLFSIRKFDGEKAKFLIEWTQSDAISTGPNVTNHLGITADDNTLMIYANGRLLGQVEDGGFYEGRFGPFVAAINSAEFTVYYEQIAYWPLVNP